MCHTCQQNNCGCPPVIPDTFLCQECPSEPCACPVKISTDCVTYDNDDLPCTGIIKGTILTDLIQQLDTYICTAIEQLYNSLNLVNIGLGAKIYKGVDGIGRKELRSIGGSSLINVTENTNDITITVDEESVEALQNNFVRNITIEETDLPSGYEVQDIIDYILALPPPARTVQPTDSKWNIFIVPGAS